MSESKIVRGMREALAHAKGEAVAVRATEIDVPSPVDVRVLRERLGLTQQAFARRFGFALGSVRNWEQGHRQPEGPARVLLKVIERRPEAVLDALRDA